MKTYSPIPSIQWIFILLVSLNLTAQATTYFYDDFESPAPPVAVTRWLDTSRDANPVGPVAQNWVVQEANPYQVQVGRFTQALSGSPWGGNDGPSWAPSASGGLQYLEMYTGPGGVSQAWAPLSAANQTQIAATGLLRLSVQVFGLSGHDSWHSNIRIAGFDSAATVGSNPAFDVELQETTSFVNGPVKYVSGAGTTNTAAGLVHLVNTWQTLVIDANFYTDTFNLSLDGNTVSNLTWAGGDLSKIQSVVLEVNSTSFQDNLFHRAGFDNFLLEVPEPSAMVLLGLSGLVLWRRWENR